MNAFVSERRRLLASSSAEKSQAEEEDQEDAEPRCNFCDIPFPNIDM